MQINLRDSNFAHHTNNSVAHNQTNRYFDWYRGDNIVSDTCFFTDLHLKEAKHAKNPGFKVAWLLEPRAINPHIYQYVRDNRGDFDYVLTFDQQLVEDGIGTFYPFGVTWIRDRQQIAYPKNKRMSLIGSSKKMTPGHHFRQDIIKRCLDRGDIDVFGRGYNFIEHKEFGLADYRYSIVLENSRDNWYFSEKIIDCFMTDTVPLYWGSDIRSWFNMDGVICFDTWDELERHIVELLSPWGDQYYDSERMRSARYDNRNRVVELDFDIPEHFMFKHYPKLFV